MRDTPVAGVYYEVMRKKESRQSTLLSYENTMNPSKPMNPPKHHFLYIYNKKTSHMRRDAMKWP